MDYFLVSVAVGISVQLYLLLRPYLKDLLLESLKQPAAVTFYLRILLFAMVLVAFGGTVAITPHAEGGFMARVWEVGSNLQTFLEMLAVVLMVYAFMVTILVVCLKQGKNE